jgi:Protein of unknown function (DUF2950)
VHGGAPAAPAADAVATPAARSFATPEEAAAALVAAMRADDEKAVRTALGPGSDALAHSGDRVADREAWERFVAAYDTKHSLAPDPLGRMALSVGDDNWPLPIPIVRSGGRWSFDSHLGARQLVERRIGRNEIAAVRTLLVCVDAQKLYFQMMSRVGTGAYAQRLVSTPDHHDGLYWPETQGAPVSPLQPLVNQAVEEGYPGADVSGKPTPYQGYYFRILTAQGDNAPTGTMDYVVDGRMTRGFAMIAWPAVYGASGIMSFEVNQDGVVFQKDLGEATDTLAPQIMLFNPDLSWLRVDVVGH